MLLSCTFQLLCDWAERWVSNKVEDVKHRQSPVHIQYTRRLLMNICVYFMIMLTLITYLLISLANKTNNPLHVLEH